MKKNLTEPVQETEIDITSDKPKVEEDQKIDQNEELDPFQLKKQSLKKKQKLMIKEINQF